VNESIVFHDEDAEDPDWKSKQSYTMLIVAALEMEMGVENLWKKGKANGRRGHPDFGQYMITSSRPSSLELFFLV
jgi:hypothetical protein